MLLTSVGTKSTELKCFQRYLIAIFLQVPVTLAGGLKFSRHLPGSTFLIQTGVSLTGCKDDCAARSACKSINYHRLSHVCQLNREADDIFNTRLLVTPGSIYGGKLHWNLPTTCTCDHKDKCEANGSCTFERCDPFQAPGETTVLGNMNTIGAKGLLTMPTSMIPYNPSPISLQCAANGTWSQELKTRKNTCLKLFRGEAAVGGNFYNIWQTGVLSTDDLICYNQGSCSGLHFRRNELVADWPPLGATTIRFSVYKDGTEVQYVIFDAVDSNSTDWFNNSRVLESSWTSLLTLQSPVFSINIFEGRRSFHMVHSYQGCTNDVIWFSASYVTQLHQLCDWDRGMQANPPTNPMLVYSVSTGPADADEAGVVDYADYIEIAACFG